MDDYVAIGTEARVLSGVSHIFVLLLAVTPPPIVATPTGVYT